MRPKEFFNLFGQSLKEMLKNPIVVIPGLVLWAFLFGFSKLSFVVNHRLQNTITITSWLGFFFLVSLCAMSFVFSGLIGMSKKGVKEKIGSRDFFKSAGKHGLRNFIVLLFLSAVSALIGQIAYYGAFYIGRFLKLGVTPALAVFILIYLAGLLGVLIFFSFSNFCLVVNDLGIIKGVRSSIKLVKKEYLAALSMSVILFVVLFLFNKISGKIAEIVEYGVLLPYFAIVLTRFVIEIEKKHKV
jgi:hypothetical protein